jgi:hypothetical protein
MKPKNLAHVALSVATLTLVACARPWNVAHEGLEVMADAVVIADGAARARMPEDYDRAEAAVLERAAADAAADTPRSVDEYLADWRSRVQPWRETFEALEAARELLLGAEAILAAWRDTGEEPREWAAICTALGELQERVTLALEGVGVTLPSVWQQVRPMLQPVCTFITTRLEATP